MLELRDNNDKILFSQQELQDDAGNGKLDYRFAIALVVLRVEYDRRMPATSICRSFVHNESVGGHERSLHVWDRPFHPVEGACAIDIVRPGGTDLHRLISIATRLRWAIGIAKSFVHLDIREILGVKLARIYTY